MPVTSKMITVQAVADRKRRSASELARMSTRVGRREQISQAAHRLDDLDAQLLANAADEHFDRIRIAIEILIVKMFNQLRARHHATGMMHQIRKQSIFVACKFDRVPVDRNTAGTGVKPDRAAVEFALRVAGGAAQQR